MPSTVQLLALILNEQHVLLIQDEGEQLNCAGDVAPDRSATPSAHSAAQASKGLPENIACIPLSLACGDISLNMEVFKSMQMFVNPLILRQHTINAAVCHILHYPDRVLSSMSCVANHYLEAYDFIDLDFNNKQTLVASFKNSCRLKFTYLL